MKKLLVLTNRELISINGGNTWTRSRLLGGYTRYYDNDGDGIWDVKQVFYSDGGMKRQITR